MAAKCYFQGCNEPGVTKEHVPPRGFFPADKREQLLTVPSCELHNNAKSEDDLYVLAHICLNASPTNESRDIFMAKVVPQLGFNEQAMKKMLARDAVPLGNGAVAYPVDSTRFDRFFTALSFGIVYKSAKRNLPTNYSVGHIYHNFVQEDLSVVEAKLREHLGRYHTEDNKEALEVLNFGEVKTLNATVYTAKLFGLPDFKSSITIAHRFFGKFRVTSMLQYRLDAAEIEGSPEPRAASRTVAVGEALNQNQADDGALRDLRERLREQILGAPTTPPVNCAAVLVRATSSLVPFPEPQDGQFSPPRLARIGATEREASGVAHGFERALNAQEKEAIAALFPVHVITWSDRKY